MDFFENLVNNSTFYYVLVGIVYFLCIAFVIMLLINNKKKHHKEIKKNESKKDLDAVDLESVLSKMQESADNQKDEVMTFEEEQEEKAIISYQELLNAVKKNVKEVTESQKINQEILSNDDKNTILEPIVLQNDNNIEVVPENTNISKTTKFQNSEFISPVYGRLDNIVEYPTIPSFDEQKKDDDLDKTIVVPKIDSKLDDNDEFLRILKEFRNNLE